MNTRADAPADRPDGLAAGLRAGAEPDRLGWFNELPSDLACAELLACCSAAGWARQVAGGRPYGSADEALRRSDAAVAAMTTGELAGALAGHPRIGDRAVLTSGAAGADADDGAAGDDAAGDGPAGKGAGARLVAHGSSRREQAGLAGADDTVLQALADGNAAYERRFGHIYLACASGRSGAELLALLRKRLDNDFAQEWLVVAAELSKINRIRLGNLLSGQS